MNSISIHRVKHVTDTDWEERTMPCDENVNYRVRILTIMTDEGETVIRLYSKFEEKLT